MEILHLLVNNLGSETVVFEKIYYEEINEVKLSIEGL